MAIDVRREEKNVENASSWVVCLENLQEIKPEMYKIMRIIIKKSICV